MIYIIPQLRIPSQVTRICQVDKGRVQRTIKTLYLFCCSVVMGNYHIMWDAIFRNHIGKALLTFQIAFFSSKISKHYFREALKSAHGVKIPLGLHSVAAHGPSLCISKRHGGWGDSLVGEVLASQTWGLMFWSHTHWMKSYPSVISVLDGWRQEDPCACYPIGLSKSVRDPASKYKIESNRGRHSTLTLDQLWSTYMLHIHTERKERNKYIDHRITVNLRWQQDMVTFGRFLRPVKAPLLSILWLLIVTAVTMPFIALVCYSFYSILVC